jgi:hypothetical protein
MTLTTTDNIVTDWIPEPSKKQIIQRLFEAGHISFNEMWTLLQDEPEVRYVPMPQATDPIITPWPYPNYPWDQPYYSTDVKDNQRLHNSGGRTPDSGQH